MDPICHTLVGASLAESGLKRRTRFGTATLLIGANLPDVDLLAVLSGDDLAFRRGWTHGVVAWVALPLALTGLVLLWERIRRRDPNAPRPIPRQLLQLAMIAVLTHPFLDWLNVYGVRLLMPFSRRWFYGDSVFIVDPWLWLLLGAGVLGSRARTWGRRASAARPARAGLALAGLYIGLMIAGTSFARGITARGLGLASAPSRRSVMVAPPALNPLRREVVVAERDRYWFGEVRWWPPGLDLRGDYVLRGFDDPRVDTVKPTKASRQLLEWARFPFYVVEGAGGGRVLRLDDARYSRGRRSWAAVTWRLE